MLLDLFDLDGFCFLVCLIWDEFVPVVAIGVVAAMIVGGHCCGSGGCTVVVTVVDDDGRS